jgi:hypothetical protein
MAAVPGLERSIDWQFIREATRRGYFRPAEEEHLICWFARFLTVRSALWQEIAELSESVPDDLGDLQSEAEWRSFALGYAAACLIVRLDRFLIEDLATHRLVQRKLNEGATALRIPRKQFTAVFESLSDPENALIMDRAMKIAQRQRHLLEAMAEDPDVGPVIRQLAVVESALDPSRRRYLKLLYAYGKHALRRLGASMRQQLTFAAFESGGRVAAELRDRWAPRRVTPEIRGQLARLLKPGDVLVTRHDVALTNLFLPGYWPHSALYVGLDSDRERLGVTVDDACRASWSGDRCVLEAKKDGVRFRPLAETLAVDAVAVLRPRLTSEEIAAAVARVAQHEGKKYNFDFDFFRSDCLVCTEVIYRAYDGLGELHFELRERAGRPTLSAEDLIDLALDRGVMEPIAVFGAPPDPSDLIVGQGASAALAASYRPASLGARP